jgi:hypothetical protein
MLNVTLKVPVEKDNCYKKISQFNERFVIAVASELVTLEKFT